MSVGQMREFILKSGNWSNYVERIEMYFKVNKVDEDLKLPTLISVMGEEAYDLLSTLASPTKPAKLAYNQAVQLLTDHLQPKPSPLSERYKFRQRRQLNNESIAEYLTELKKLSTNCEFENTLDDNIRDQLVCGLKSEVIRQRLFAEEKITYKRAVSLALSLEAAERDAGAVDRGGEERMESVHRVLCNECPNCGGRNHQANDCLYKDYVCSGCQQVGHLRRRCPKLGASYNVHGQARRSQPAGAAGGSYEYNGARGGRGGGRGWRRAGRGARGAPGRARTQAPFHLMEEQDAPGHMDNSDVDECEDCEEEPMYQMSLSKYKPVCITIKVQNRLLNMEVDTGSALSCISKQVYFKLFSELHMKSCCLNLKFYDGSIIKPCGYIETVVSYKGIIKTLDLYIIDRGTTNLLGRQWLAELNIPVRMPTPRLENYYQINCATDKNKLISEIISRHESLFDGTLGEYKGGAAELCVRPGAEPIFCRARPLPFALRERVDAELDAMLRTGVIEPVERADWATPLVVVRKPDGGMRICADYKVTLNRALAIDRFPVPKMDDLFSNLSGNRFFTKLDLSQAYNQIVLSERSRDYTVINTHRGLFRYSRLVYGLSSSPGIFARIMGSIFKNVPNVLIFYDDILIKNEDLDSHLKTIDEVLQILEKNGLKIKQSKCEFMATEVRYLGFIVNQDGVRADPEKVKAITTMPHPTNVSELKSFLGMANFYGKFIKNLSSHLSPLYELLKKGKHWKWGHEQDLAFKRVKDFLSSSETLTHFDMQAESVLTVDASARGLGAVLAQRAAPGPGARAGERVVAYASRALTAAELHYSQIQKEALAIVFAVDKFHQYLYGRRFVLRTDHKPLVSIFGPNVGIPSAAASRLQRWAIKLSAYDFQIEYVRTDKNTADVLSRLINSQKNEIASEVDIVPEQTYLHFSTDALLLDYEILKKETRNDPILSRVLSYIVDGWPLQIDIREMKPYLNRKNELYTELGCIMWGQRVVIPFSCREKVISELHDPHMGTVKTKALARSYVWWPGVDEAVERACRACAVCAAVADAPPGHAPRSWPWPSRPWSRLHLDFLGPIMGMTYLIVVDSCSKWIEAIKMQRTTAQAVIAVLRDLWAKFGLPKQTVSDNGPPFSSAEFQKFLKHNGIDHIYTAPYHPASNGAAENSVKICKRTIKKAIKQNLDVDVALNRFLLAYRNTEHSTTGDSPARLLQGRSLRMRLDNLKPDRDTRVTARQQRSEQASGGAQRQFASDAPVWYRDYSGSDKWAPGLIITKLGSTDYSVRGSFGTTVHRHVDQLRQRVTNKTRSEIPSSPAKINSDTATEKTSNSRQSRSSLSFPILDPEEQERRVSRSGEMDLKDKAIPPPPEVAAAATPPARKHQPSVPAEAESCSNEVAGLRTKRSIRDRKPPVRYGFDFD